MKNQNFRSGFVSIIGKPNVGKSTLLNALIGEKLSITNRKAQTTRHRIKGILTEENYQIVFSDTPGIIKPSYKLQEDMMHFVSESLKDSDVVLFIEELNMPIEKVDVTLLEKLKSLEAPLFLILNKIDLGTQEDLENKVAQWQEVLSPKEIIPVSALEKFNLEKVLELIIAQLPVHPPYYAKDELSDKNYRFFIEEIIREKILDHYKQEIPYSVEIKIDEYTEEPEIDKIRATIYVNRESQKSILIGKQGRALKRSMTDARKAAEKLLDKKVFLETHVKVKKNWRDDDRQLKSFGYKE